MTHPKDEDGEHPLNEFMYAIGPTLRHDIGEDHWIELSPAVGAKDRSRKWIIESRRKGHSQRFAYSHEAMLALVKMYTTLSGAALSEGDNGISQWVLHAIDLMEDMSTSESKEPDA